jgi:DNA-binding MarR family transcriptional regulator
MELGWQREADQRAWWAFLDLWRALGSGMERQLASVGVSAADYQLLAPLAESASGMRPRDLCAASGWDRSRVAHQLRRMEERGLVERDRVSEDARGVIVRLTERGRDMLEHAAPGHVEWVKVNFINVATRDELNALTDLSLRVVEKVNETAHGGASSASAKAEPPGLRGHQRPGR